MITCPGCNGAGGGEGFIHSSNGECSYGSIPCSLCNGAKWVTFEVATAYTLGRAMAKERQGRDMSSREEAKRLSISVVDLSDIEHGRQPKTDAGRAALERRTEEMATYYSGTAT